MPQNESAKKTIEYLEELEKNTEIVRFDLSKFSSRNILRDYIKKHTKEVVDEKTNEKKRVSDLSFNDFIKQHPDYKEQCKGKVVVAEITGGVNGVSLGYDENDKYSDDKITIDGGDFTGCRFNDVEFYAMDNVSLRDSVLDKVRIIGGKFSDIDLRGSNFYKCEFFSDGTSHSLDGVQLEYANPDTVQDKGVFEIKRSNIGLALEVAEDEIKEQQKNEVKEEIQKYLNEQSQKQSYFQMRYSMMFGASVNPEELAKSIIEKNFSKKDLSTVPSSLLERVQPIKEKYEKLLKEKKKEVDKAHSIRFKTPVLDPTYTPNQSLERANAIKISFKATKADLQQYQKYIKSLKKGEKTISFNDFIANKNSEKIKEIQKANPEKMVVPIADLSKENLSGMKLSGLDLSEVNLSYCNMEKSDLEGTNFKGSCLEGSNLTEANLQEVNLTDCNMIGITAEKTDFKEAIMIRTRANCSDLENANMESVIGYQSVFAGSNMERSSIRKSDMRKSDLEGVNLRYVDAQYANLQKANLSKSVADHANFYRANLSGAILDNIQARETNFESAVLDGVQAHFADLQKSNLENVQAKGSDFSGSDLKEIKAKYANFEKAILDKADMEFAKFEKAVLVDVKAREANFKNAVLKDIDGTRIDVSNSILEKANFENAKLKEAVMKDVQARKANFRKAFLEKANLQRGAFVGTDFREANLANTAVQGGVFLASDFEKANVSHMKIDEATILIDANLRGIIGDEETVKALRNQQKSQHKLQEQWFGRSRYGVPNIDERGDRFKCQRLGAAVLSAAIGGGASLAGGPLAGISTAALTALISDKALTATKDHYFSDLGYINNALGDRLAEVGAVALSMGVGAADRAIDGAVAGVVCSFAGAVQGTALTAVGVGTTLGGLKLAMDGVKEQSKWKKYAGMALSGVGAVASFFGISSLGASLNTIAYGAAIGGITGGLWAGVSSARRLYEYDEKNPKAGARPEQIYQESINRAKGIWRKIVPTMKKVMLGLALATVAAAVVVAAVYALPALPFVGAFGTTVIAGNAGLTAAAAGFFTGYLFDDKIIPIKKSQETKGVKKEKEVKKLYGREAYNQEKGKGLEHEKSKTEHKSKKITSKSKLTPEVSKEKPTQIKTSVKEDTSKESTKHQKKEERNVIEPVKSQKSQTEIPKSKNTNKKVPGKMAKKFAKSSDKPKTFVERVKSEESQIKRSKD